KVTPRTKAIIPVHFAGLPADIAGFDRLGKMHGIPVIYDAAHAVGTRQNGSGIGGAGKARCYSFQSNKNMTCLGEGGAVTTDDGIPGGVPVPALDHPVLAEEALVGEAQALGGPARWNVQ